MFPLCLHLDPDELIVYNYSPTQMHGLLCLFSAVKHGCVSDKHRICFLFLLLSPKRDFTTHCIVLTYLKITYTNRNKKTTPFIHFWSPHCVWVPHHHLESLLHILCKRSESVSRHYLRIFPSFHIFHLKFQILFSKGSFCLLKKKNPVSCPNFIPDTMQWAVGHLGSASAGMTHITQTFSSLAQRTNLHNTQRADTLH